MHRDAIVIGGSFAGLSAAMYIARALRSVAVLDTGLPRNRFADHSHGFFGQDGGVPGEMLARAREQVAAYPTVSFIEERAVAAEKQGDGFAVRLAVDHQSGHHAVRIDREIVGAALLAFLDVDTLQLKRRAGFEQGEMDDEVDAAYGETLRRSLEWMSSHANEIPQAMCDASVAKYLERIADHATNLAEHVIYLEKGDDVRHRRTLDP